MHFPAHRDRPGTALSGELSPAKSRIWRMLDRYLWLCPLAMLAAAAAILAALGFSPWTIVLALILLGCPMAGFVAWLTGRQSARARRSGSGVGER